MCYLFILDKRPLPNTWIEIIFSLPLACLFIYLTVSFEEGFSFSWSLLYTFFSFVCSFYNLFKKFLFTPISFIFYPVLFSRSFIFLSFMYISLWSFLAYFNLWCNLRIRVIVFFTMWIYSYFCNICLNGYLSPAELCW